MFYMKIKSSNMVISFYYVIDTMYTTHEEKLLIFEPNLVMQPRFFYFFYFWFARGFNLTME